MYRFDAALLACATGGQGARATSLLAEMAAREAESLTSENEAATFSPRGRTVGCEGEQLLLFLLRRGLFLFLSFFLPAQQRREGTTPAPLTAFRMYTRVGKRGEGNERRTGRTTRTIHYRTTGQTQTILSERGSDLPVSCQSFVPASEKTCFAHGRFCSGMGGPTQRLQNPRNDLSAL